MDGEYSSLSILGGMFSHASLRKFSELDPRVEGCKPSDFSSDSCLEEYFEQLWEKSIAIWEKYGASKDNQLTVESVEKFFQQLMANMVLQLKHSKLSNESKELVFEFGGSLWHLRGSQDHLDLKNEMDTHSPQHRIQTKLNTEDEHVWGLLSNGHIVRILRKNENPNIPQALEFDLRKIFAEHLTDDFRLFATMVHGTRWPHEQEKPMECWLETWYNLSKNQEIEFLEVLRESIEKAANVCGTGIIRHDAANEKILDDLVQREAFPDELRRDVFTYIFKLIFLFIIEDRGLLFPEGDGSDRGQIEDKRNLYYENCSILRYRNKLDDDEGDEEFNMFDDTMRVFEYLFRGSEEYGIPEQGSILFGENSTPLIKSLRLRNSDFKAMLRHLCTLGKKDDDIQMNWKFLVESKLGGVYESLLELRPKIDMEERTFSLESKPGNERKSTGSFYTPSKLVESLILTTVEPLLEKAKETARKKSTSPEDFKILAREEILKIRVCDPASGSGHFLIAALERIAIELARIETGENSPGFTPIQEMMQIASLRCIYGVDINPLAAELCKFTLWALTCNGKNPMSSYDSRIRHGNSLLGQRLDTYGIIDSDAISKSWNKTRKAHRNRMKELSKLENMEESSQLDEMNKQLIRLNQMFDENQKKASSGLAAFGMTREANGLDENEIKQEIESLKWRIEEREAQLPRPLCTTIDLMNVMRNLSEDAESRDRETHWVKEVLDASMAMWWWPEPSTDKKDEMIPSPLSSVDFHDYIIWLTMEYGIEEEVMMDESKAGITNLSDNHTRFQNIRELTELIAHEKSFFHWELEFPEIFIDGDETGGGFTVELGNPPFVFARGNLGKRQKEYLKARYPSADYQANLYAFFILKHLEDSPNGTLGLITPNNWVTLLTGEYLRRALLNHATPPDIGPEKQATESSCTPFDLMIFNHPQGQFQDASVDTLSLVLAPSSSRGFLNLDEESVVDVDTSNKEPMFFHTQLEEDYSSQEIKFQMKVPTNLIDPKRAISPRIYESELTLEFINHMADEKNCQKLGLISNVKAGLAAYEVGRGTPEITEEMMEKRVYHSDTKVDESWSKYLDGVDVERYNLNWSGGWILYGENLAHPRDARLYQGQRIVVRQIPGALPHAIHATICDENYINDRNSMIVKCDDSPYSIYFILGVLNSKVTSTWFDYYFDKFQRNLFPQFKIAELGEFPMPNIDMRTEEGRSMHEKLHSLVIHRLKATDEKEIQSIEDSIDEAVLKAFDSPSVPK